MKKLLLLSVLMLGASWMAAQNYPSSGQKDSSQMSGKTTVEGCLSGSDGKYMLTDKQGNSIQLTGDTSKLAEHVGHEVKVTGTTGAGEGSQTSASQSMEVSSLKHISKTCKSAGGEGMSH